MRTYSELIQIPTFEDRFEYLKVGGEVGGATFGSERYLNQAIYRSNRWKQLRDYVIVRDNGCDLAHPDHPIFGPVIIHHLNPITIEDIERGSDLVWDPEFLVCTVHITHNAIHYSDYNLLPKEYIPRTPNDTCPWK